jgi:hypothetical protein
MSRPPGLRTRRRRRRRSRSGTRKSQGWRPRPCGGSLSTRSNVPGASVGRTSAASPRISRTPPSPAPTGTMPGVTELAPTSILRARMRASYVWVRITVTVVRSITAARTSPPTPPSISPGPHSRAAQPHGRGRRPVEGPTLLCGLKTCGAPQAEDGVAATDLDPKRPHRAQLLTAAGLSPRPAKRPRTHGIPHRSATDSSRRNSSASMCR